MSGSRFLFVNGVVSPISDTQVSTVLESHPGAYTTTRTHNNATNILFWERHLQRLANSVRILSDSHRELLFDGPESVASFSFPLRQSVVWDSMVTSLVNDSIVKALPVGLKERRGEEELMITTLVSGNWEKLSCVGKLTEENIRDAFDVYVHLGMYVPPIFGIPESAACLAVVGRGRKVANAKYSDWVRLRKSLEKLRPPLVTELLLSNDGDQILEGCLTNFFVVCHKSSNADNLDDKERNMSRCSGKYTVEIQTAPLCDGVLPGVVRQVIVDICVKIGITFREVAPRWSERDMWKEAFVTNSLRLLQHVESIQVPTSWMLVESNTWEEVTWEEQRFKESPGMITTLIQKEIMEKAGLEGYPVNILNET